MTHGELQTENRELREKLHVANARIAQLESNPPKKDPLDFQARAREATPHKKVDDKPKSS